MELAFGIILLVAAVFLIVAVLMQHGKSHHLSGTIAGGAETFFGKSKAQTIDKKLSRVTTIISIIFVVLALVIYVVQEDTDYEALFSSLAEAQMQEDAADDSDAAEDADGEDNDSDAAEDADEENNDSDAAEDADGENNDDAAVDNADGEE